MNCKNHNDVNGEFTCTICKENFCENCISEGTDVICYTCKEKQQLSNEILHDILGNANIDTKIKNNFNEYDILKQIEDEINNQQIEHSDLSNVNIDTIDVYTNFNTEEKIIDKIEAIVENNNSNINNKNDISSVSEFKTVTSEYVQEFDFLDNINDVKIENLSPQVENVNDLEINTTEFNSKHIDTTVMKNKLPYNHSEVPSRQTFFDYLKQQFSKLSSTTKTKATNLKENYDSKYFKEKSENLKSNTNNLVTSAKQKTDNIKNAYDTEYFKEKSNTIKSSAVNFSSSIKEKSKTFSENINSKNQSPCSDTDNCDTNMPNQMFEINDILYFIASLIPGFAQAYIGLTKRGITIIFIAFAFGSILFEKPQLLILTAILSFIDAHKIRRLYYLGYELIDSNRDIYGLIFNFWVILIIVLTVLFGQTYSVVI